jgi:hypothetical protein
MADLTDLLREALRGVEPADDALERTIGLIRRRERRRRVLAGSVAVAVFVAVGAGAWVASDTGRGSGPPGSSAAAPATPSPSTVEAPDPGRREVFVPPVRRDRGRLVMPLAFPDGSTAELVYAPRLELAAMGVQPDVSFLRRDRPASRFPLRFWFGRPGAELFEGDQPLVHAGGGGRDRPRPRRSGDGRRLRRDGGAGPLRAVARRGRGWRPPARHRRREPAPGGGGRGGTVPPAHAPPQPELSP